MSSVKESYDSVAEEYERNIYDELAGKPFDRNLLAEFVEEVDGTICDLGCGPGHVSAFLAHCGASVVGVDLSPQMLRIASKKNPQITFVQSDFFNLDFSDDSFSGVLALYSLIHAAPENLPLALAEIRRVLKPGGSLLASFHIGDESLHLDQWWGVNVDIDFYFYQPGELCRHVNDAGFQEIHYQVREPYPDVEHQSRRVYIRATAPG